MGLLSGLRGDSQRPSEKIHEELDEVIVELDNVDTWIKDNKSYLDPEALRTTHSSVETAQNLLEKGLEPKIEKIKGHIGTIESQLEQLEREASKEGASERVKHNLKLSEKALDHLETEEESIEGALRSVDRQLPTKGNRSNSQTRIASDKEKKAFEKLEAVLEREDNRLHKLKQITDSKWKHPR